MLCITKGGVMWLDISILGETAVHINIARGIGVGSLRPMYYNWPLEPVCTCSFPPRICIHACMLYAAWGYTFST
jgi:hypothetical protein